MIVLTLLAAASAAMPGSMVMPVAKNDAFVFSDGHVEQVRSVKNGSVEWGGLTKRSYWRPQSPFLPITTWTTGAGEGRRTIIGRPEEMWPLGAKRSTHFRVVTETRRKGRESWVRNVEQWDCKAGKLRNIKVRAGEFEAARIVCDRFSPTNMKLVERMEWDFAPAIGHYVRRVRINYARADKRTIELVSALHGPSASQDRLKALARSART